MLAPRNFSDLITFTRASSATRFNASGVLETVGNNVARLDFDPATLAARGLLIEEQRTNLATYSEQFDNAAWNKANTTVSANSTNAPSGAATADSLVETATTALHYVDTGPFTITSGLSYSFSVFLKANQRNLVTVQADGATGSLGGPCVFDLSAGTVVANGGGVSSVTIAPIGNGWYRCAISAVATGTSTRPAIGLRITSGGGFESYAGTAGSGVYVWGAQLEAGAFPTSYIPTTTAAVTRSADVASVNTLSPWFNASGGTLYAEATRAAFGSNDRNIATLSDGTGSNVIELWASSSVALGRFAVTSSGSLVANLSAAGFAEGAVGKLAGSFAANDFRCYVNGTQMTPDNSGSLPALLTQFAIGARYGSSFPFNGHIRRVSYYPRALSDAELQALTA